MARVIFSLTQHQAEALVAFANGDAIESRRVMASLWRKDLVRRAHWGRWRMTLTQRGRAALTIARTLVKE
jgi:hypothetical protein